MPGVTLKRRRHTERKGLRSNTRYKSMGTRTCQRMYSLLNPSDDHPPHTAISPQKGERLTSSHNDFVHGNEDSPSSQLPSSPKNVEVRMPSRRRKRSRTNLNPSTRSISSRTQTRQRMHSLLSPRNNHQAHTEGIGAECT